MFKGALKGMATEDTELLVVERINRTGMKRSGMKWGTDLQDS